MATDAAARLESEDGKEGGWESEFTKKERKKKCKKMKLGDSIELHEKTDWPWDASEGDWDGMEDRAERNRVKKEKEKERRSKRVDKAVRVGQCTLGIGPIKQESFDYFYNITADFDKAKRMAAAEFLTEYLRFDHRDMADINITDTKVSGKRDDVLYLILDSPTKVRDIRRRIADCQNPAIKTREYIPPLFFDRYSALSKLASEMRQEDKDLKTQICFIDQDIALFTKKKGTDNPFKMADMGEIERNVRLPPPDHSVSWKQRPEKAAMETDVTI